MRCSAWSTPSCGPITPEVRDEVGLAVSQRRVGCGRDEPLEVGCAADDEDVLRTFAAALERDRAIRLVRRDHDVGERERPPLGGERQPVEEVSTAVEAGLVQLGNEVVVIEDERGPAALEHAHGGQQQIRRVARLHDLERLAPGEAQRESARLPERGSVLAGIPGRAAGCGLQRVAVDLDAVPQLDRLAVALASLRADHAHLETGAGERRALLPHPPVERHRQVLDEDQRSTTRHRGTPRGRGARARRRAGRGR